MYTKTTISGIDLHWNYQKHFWFIYIKELLVQKYWQLISTKQLWSVRNIVSSKSQTVQYRVPRCPGQYRNVQDRVPRCPSQYRDVQIPRCPGPEMSRIHTIYRMTYFLLNNLVYINQQQKNSYGSIFTITLLLKTN